MREVSTRELRRRVKAKLVCLVRRKEDKNAREEAAGWLAKNKWDAIDAYCARLNKSSLPITVQCDFVRGFTPHFGARIECTAIDL